MKKINCVGWAYLPNGFKISTLTPALSQRRGSASGFTLAEVLITLVIIGIIAAITVPTLISKYQKEQTVTKLKKAYSTLAQTTNRAIADYGPMLNWEIGPGNTDDNSTKFVKKYITPYMNILKETKSQNEGNWNNKYYFLNNTPHTYSNSYTRFYLNDGTSMTAYTQADSDNTKRCWIDIDINGDKKPNKYGKDIFCFIYVINEGNSLRNGKIVSVGQGANRIQLLSDSSDMCNKKQNGTRCAALLIQDGWQIKDDYPW